MKKLIGLRFLCLLACLLCLVESGFAAQCHADHSPITCKGTKDKKICDTGYEITENGKEAKYCGYDSNSGCHRSSIRCKLPTSATTSIQTKTKKQPNNKTQPKKTVHKPKLTQPPKKLQH